MADERRIARYDALLCSTSAHVVTERVEGGEFVKYDDHQDALGEAQLEAGDLRVELEQMTKDRDAALAKLESLRSGLKAEVERLRKLTTYHLDSCDRAPLGSVAAAEYEHRASDCILTGDRLERLLDASEDTEKQSADLRSRPDIAYVAGHLEGYASMLGRLGSKANLRALIEGLREDAEKLKQSGGGDGS